MNADYIFIVGVLAAVFALPSALNAMTESRFPRTSVSLVALSAFAIAFANQMQPHGYQMGDVGPVFARVFGQLLN